MKSDKKYGNNRVVMNPMLIIPQPIDAETSAGMFILYLERPIGTGEARLDYCEYLNKDEPPSSGIISGDVESTDSTVPEPEPSSSIQAIAYRGALSIQGENRKFNDSN